MYSALFSIFVGTIILNLSGETLPTAGAFSLSGYNNLNPVKSAISSYNSDDENSWKRIGIQNIVMDQEDSSLQGSDYYDPNAFHFIVCNGLVGDNGQIITTENWKKQRLVYSWRWQEFGRDVILVGIITDGRDVTPTEVQFKRANSLAGELARKFDIPPVSIFTPFF